MKKFKLLSVLLLVLLVVGCGCSKKDDSKKEKKDPNTPAINYDKIGDLKIGTSSFYISGEYTYISVSIINESSKDITPTSVTAILKDEAGTVLKSELINVGTIKGNKTKEIKDHPIVGKYTSAATITFAIK